MMLGETRREGEEVLRKNDGGQAWTIDGYDLRRFRYFVRCQAETPKS